MVFNQYGLYAQDEWNILENLKLTGGIRFDMIAFNDDDLMRNNAIYDLDFGGRHIDTGAWPDGNVQISPRIGFTWDVFGDKSLKVRGGTGLFAGRLPLVFFTNMPTNSGMVQNLVHADTYYSSNGVVTSSDPRLQNFAGGLIVLLFKPYKVGDWIESQGVSGTVKEIQIFHTILTTGDNKVIYIPNGAMSSGVVTNYNTQTTRRVEWIVGVDYGEDYNKVQQIVRDILTADNRILTDPAPFIALHALDASSVNVVARVWVNTADYWGVYFDINKTIYETFNEKGINFPFPQLTVHQGN